MMFGIVGPLLFVFFLILVRMYSTLCMLCFFLCMYMCISLTLTFFLFLHP
jgi:hypothetical protein